MARFRHLRGIINLKNTIMKYTLPKFSVMNRMIPIVVIAASMVACNSNPKVDSAQKAIPDDTTGLAQFQAWKAQNELATPNANTQPATKTVVKYYPVKSSSSGTMNSSSSNTAKATQKKGWSSAAKGAVIGGVAGAAGGAILNKKNRVVGGVVGGVLGAGAGYGIGRHIDKKKGRY
jgi:hypothetical protein